MNNETLNKIQKMQYLKTVLTGEAVKLIAHMDIVDKKLESAWYILEKCYENKRARSAHRIISGPINRQMQEFNQSLCLMASINELGDKIQQFWETEEIPDLQTLTVEQEKCIEHFTNTIRRDANGSYVVSLSFKEDPTMLTTYGDSRRMAMAQLFSNGKKIRKRTRAKNRIHSQYE